MIHQGCPRPRIYHGRLNSLPRSLRLYVLSLPLVSQFPLGPSLCHGFLIRPGGCLLRPGGLLSRLLRPGGLRSRLLHPGGLLSHLLRPGGLLSRLLRSRLPHMDLALRLLPRFHLRPTALLDCSMCGASGSRSLGGGLCHESGS